MWSPDWSGLVERTRRACRHAAQLEAAGRPSLAEAILRRAIRRAAAAGNAQARQVGCESLSRFYLGQARIAEAAVWQQQGVAAWCEAGCLGAPDLMLAASVGLVGNDEPSVGVSRRRVVGSQLLELARARVAVRDWAGALRWAAAAEQGVGGRERRVVRQFRQAVEVLAALEAGRR
jgi:hypothetical protein